MAKQNQRRYGEGWIERAPLPRRKAPEKQPKKPKDQGEVRATGFDGRTVKVPKEEAGRNGGSSSSSSLAATSAKELADLKAMMRKMINGEHQAFTEGQLRILESDPRDSMRERQRELNRQRKSYNREKAIEQKLQANEEKRETWMHMQRTIVRQERERYEMEQARLRKDLEKLQHQNEGMEEEESTFPDLDLESLPSTTSNQVLDQRVLQAEKAASDAQQAMLMMQQQVQQLYYLQHASAQALQNHGISFEMEPAAASNPATASPTFNTGSPQLPKGVRNGVLKAKAPKTTAKAPKEKPAESKDTETIDLEGEEHRKDGL